MRHRHLVCALLGLLSAMPLAAHHSAASLYLVDRQITVEGKVTEYRPINPHIRVYFDVTSASGEVQHWLAEGGTRNVLLRRGWTGSELKPGDVVTIVGNPSRDGSFLMHCLKLRLPDGKELFCEDQDFESLDQRRRRAAEHGAPTQ